MEEEDMEIMEGMEAMDMLIMLWKKIIIMSNMMDIIIKSLSVNTSTMDELEEFMIMLTLELWNTSI
jgi:hypothetical protein